MYRLARARPLLSAFRQNGIAQQKRGLSIHEYLSADLLRTVFFFIMEIIIQHTDQDSMALVSLKVLLLDLQLKLKLLRSRLEVMTW
jgi:hypothetical protein